jgi:membrane associated rhomboid family serine protease
VLRLPPLTPFVRSLLIALGVIFVMGAVLGNFIGVPIVQLLALDPISVGVPTLWQVFTHALFLPPDSEAVFQLLLSILFIWWMLAPFEAEHGRARAIQLSIVATVAAALGALLVGQLLPAHFAAYVCGPSPITLAAFCGPPMLVPPNARLSVFGMFKVRPIHLIYFAMGLSVVYVLTTRNAAALAANLGAIGGGIGYVKLWMLRPPPRNTPNKRQRMRESGRLRLVRDDDDDPKRWLN